jgi:hypothetical protein
MLPNSGTVTGVPFTYTPNPGFRGADVFAYTVTNQATGETSLPASLTILDAHAHERRGRHDQADGDRRPGDARRTKLDAKAKGPVTVGTASSASAAGKVTLQLSAKARKALKKLKKVKLTVTLVATDAAGNRTTRTLSMTLAR